MNRYIRKQGHMSGRRNYNNACPNKGRSLQKKNYYTFFCRYNNAGNDFRELMQGILYNDRTCLIGMDVWRLLNRMDTCEYPYKRYSSIEEANISFMHVPDRYYMEK